MSSCSCEGLCCTCKVRVSTSGPVPRPRVTSLVADCRPQEGGGSTQWGGERAGGRASWPAFAFPRTHFSEALSAGKWGPRWPWVAREVTEVRAQWKLAALESDLALTQRGSRKGPSAFQREFLSWPRVGPGGPVFSFFL